MAQDTRCPYCKRWQDVIHTDGSDFKEGVKYQQRCTNCGKVYAFNVAISFSYESTPVDCLNDGNHAYQLTLTIPRVLSKMKCAMCDHEREMTEPERKSHKIGTLDQYYERLIKKLAVGQILIAIDPCTMSGFSRGQSALIVGKEYEILNIFEDQIIINSELGGRNHYFKINMLTKFFKLPEGIENV